MNGYNFTERVRTSLALAREESVRLHHEYVGTEHMLLGLIREGNGVAATVLQNLNIDQDEIRQKIDATVKKGQAAQATGHDLPYTSRAKKVLELAMTEARELGHSYVGTEHLLLGLLREEKGIAAQVLAYAGLTREAARAEVLRIPRVEARTAFGPPARSAESDANSRLEQLLLARAHFVHPKWQLAFVLLWMTLGIVVLVESARPLLRALSGSEQVAPHLAVLASVEVVGALLFLMPRTLRYGAWILLAVFAIAIVVHIAKGEFPAPLFVYAAGTFFVLTQRMHRGHGPLRAAAE